MKTRRPPVTGLGVFGFCAGGLVWLHAQSLQFTGVQRLTKKEVALTLTAPVGRAYRVESTTNLPEWSGLFTFPTNLTTSLQHTDDSATFKQWLGTDLGIEVRLRNWY